MGVLLSRFRKKKSTIEILEGIEKDISSLQALRRQNQERQKKFIASLILYSILIYIGSALLIYFYYWPRTWRDGLLYSSPMLLFPVLIWLIKKFLHWYYVKRIAKSDIALAELREKKKKILEDVMETETYKKAKEILEKFDPERYKQLEAPATPKPVVPPNSDVRQRINASMAKMNTKSPLPGAPVMRPLTPYPKSGTPRPYTTPQIPRSGEGGMQPRQLLKTPQYNANAIYGLPPGPPLPRPVFAKERSKMDRVLEYLVGDGPQNRYALICKSCHSHNGMALKEEFEYLSFRCCYCYHMNAARKQRPYAPRLDIPAQAVPKEKISNVSTREDIEEDEERDDETDDSEIEEDEANSEHQSKGPKSSVRTGPNMTQDTHVSTTSFTEESPSENSDNMQTSQMGDATRETRFNDSKGKLMKEEEDFQHIDAEELTEEEKKTQ